MYANGRGVPKDDQQAVVWYRKAAEYGLPDARYSLGLAYENGQGIPQDLTLAMAWFRKAAEQGHKEAKAKLDELETIQKANERH
jgi:TPR repeat protein